MNVAFGIVCHSGWGVLVVVGKRNGEFVVIDRRRIELVEEEWAKQPYHAAEELDPSAARNVVVRGIEAARRIAVREIRAAVKREADRKNEATTCAVLVGNPMPDWSIEGILAVHFRMHKAEGYLFRDALLRAAKSCRLRQVAIPEKLLMKQAMKILGTSESGILKQVAALGKSAGPPWGKDQKNAAVVALVALQESLR